MTPAAIAQAPTPAFRPGDQVRTPSGRLAIVVEAQDERGEVAIEWPDGQRARFRVTHLQRAGEA